MTSRSAALPWLAALAVVVMWSSSFIVIRAGAEHFSPGPLSLLRIGSAALATIPLWLSGRVKRPGSPRLWGITAGWGIAWFALYMVVLNAAEVHVDAATAAMLVQLSPLIVAVVSGLLLGEGLPGRLIAGIAVAFAGIVLITIGTSSGRISAIGVALALVAALLYAACVLIQKPALAHIDSLSMTAIGILAGAVVLLPFAPQLVAELRAAPLGATLAVVYMGVLPTALAYLLWGYALSHLPAGLLSSSTLLVPAVTLLMSAVLLGEAPPLIAAIGGAMGLVGAGFALWPSVRASLRAQG